MWKPCIDCGTPTTSSRCPLHTSIRKHPASTTTRGYGSAHQRARAQLARTLPSPCGYCGTTIIPTTTWVAAHVVDGDPSYGYFVAHPACNERAKQPRQGRVQPTTPTL